MHNFSLPDLRLQVFTDRLRKLNIDAEIGRDSMLEPNPKFVLYYILVINTVTFCLFAWDKRLARNHRRRIRERNLMLASVLGGSIGGLAGMHIFRHKTRHIKFKWGLPLIMFLQGCLLYYLFP